MRVLPPRDDFVAEGVFAIERFPAPKTPKSSLCGILLALLTEKIMPPPNKSSGEETSRQTSTPLAHNIILIGTAKKVNAKKPLNTAPARLQRMLLRLQKYDLEIHHQPGKEIPVADKLSRMYLQETDNMSEEFEAQVHLIKANLPVSSQRMQEVKEKTSEDPKLVELTND
ncbi:hypothetical protein Bbelb_296090 [Branchiostoma belcheri]|nr:hypothetical protein Bbelb_296090 [Branchiostoma belcheri]